MNINEWYNCCPLVSWGVWRQCPVTIFLDTCPWPSWAPSWKSRIYEGDLFPVGLERDIVASSARNTWPSLFAIQRNVQGVSVVFLQVLPSSAPPLMPSSGSLVQTSLHLRDFAWGLQMMLSGRGPSKEAAGAATHYEDARRGWKLRPKETGASHLRGFGASAFVHLFMLCFTAFHCNLIFKTRNRPQKNNNLWKEKLLILWFFLNYLFYQIYIMNILHILQWTFYKAFILRYTLLHDFFHILLFYFIEFLSLFLSRTLKVMIIVRAK